MSKRYIFSGGILLLAVGVVWLADEPPVQQIHAAVAVSDRAPAELDFDAYSIKGWELARRQIERGLPKPLASSDDCDQSLESLRDTISESRDERLKALLPMVDRLEQMLRDSQSKKREYVDGLIDDLAPLALYIQQQTGLPASIILAQIALESGWGGSNMTILRNNVLGLGNSRRDGVFEVEVEVGDLERTVRVLSPRDTQAYAFDSVGDSILYYVYVLLESPSTATQYAELREFIANHRGLYASDPEHYRDRVLELIALSYHANPEWYEQYLGKMVAELAAVEQRMNGR